MKAKPGNRRRYSLTAGLVLLAATGGGVAWHTVLAGRAASPRVALTTAVVGDFQVNLPLEGTLQSDRAITVSTGKAPGELTMIVPDGTVVKQGDVFCRIEARELLRKQIDAELAYKQAAEEIGNTRENAQQRFETDQRSLEQAKDNFKVWQQSVDIQMTQAQQQLEFDQAEAKRLQTEYERMKRLAEKSYVAGSAVDVAKASYEAQQFKVDQSQKDLTLTKSQTDAQRRQKEAQLAASERRTGLSQGRIKNMVERATKRAETAKKQLDNVVAALKDTTIVCPAAGTVALFSTFRGGERRSWREGDQVSTGTPLGSVAGSEEMSVRCRVPESLIDELQLRQPAEIEFQALAGRNYQGEVSSIGVVARAITVEEDPTAQAGERVFDVLVKVKTSSTKNLKPGLNARVRVSVRTLPKVLTLPLEAVFEQEGKSYVFVKRGETFARREVQTGEGNEVAVVITDGLSPGEEVALSDPTAAARKARKRA